MHYGVGVNSKDIDGDTPLLNACQHGNENIIKCLVEYGADVNKENDSHASPLPIAYYNGYDWYDHIVNYLLVHGAKLISPIKFNTIKKNSYN